MMRRAWLHVRSALLRRRLEREMQEEMREHLERSTSRYMARGLSMADARRAAEREFGNVAYLQEQARDARGTAWLDGLVGDLRYALRQYARRPATTFVMFFVLATGMGISTLLFSFVHSYATQPPPGVTASDELVRIRGSQSAGVDGRGGRTFPEAEFVAYTQLTDHFAEVAGWTAGSALLDAGPEHRGVEARVTFVTDNYFSVLGVRPALGRALGAAAADDAQLATAVISHAAWDALFGRAPDAIGRTVTLNGVAVTIVGVAPERFLGVGGWGDYRFWMPLEARHMLFPDDVPAWFYAAGVLQAGVTPRQATAATAVIAAAHALSEPAAAEPAVDPSTDVVPLRAASGDPMFERDVKLMSALVGLLALVVLLITCTNVSALLTGLATARRQEIAIRLSLGAARARLVRQLLTESALLACIAAGAALGFAWTVVRLVDGTIPDAPVNVRVSVPAAFFALGVGLAVGVVFGLSPALHATRLAVGAVLRDAAANVVATRGRLQRALVTAQIAFTQPLMVLLAALLVLVVSEFKPAPRAPFADSTVFVSLRVATATGMSTRESDLATLLDASTARIIEGAQELPGFVVAVPQWRMDMRIGGYGPATTASSDSVAQVVRLSSQQIDPGYFDVMGLPLVRGRTFTPDERLVRAASAQVPVIIDVALARELWGDSDAIGRELRPASDTAVHAPRLMVVGVVDDPASRRAVADIDHSVFLPRSEGQVPGGVLLRTAAPAASQLATIRSLAQEAAPGALVEVRTFAEITDQFERHFRMAAGGVSAAGLAALLLSAIGLYAVIAFAVGQRTREIAVRMAVGGAQTQIVRRFVLDGLRLTGIGLVVGLPVSLLALNALMSVPDVPQVGLQHVALVAALSVLLVATAAAWLPARRAAAVDPAVTLRSE